MELFEALDVSRGEFERRLALIGDDEWGRPTPCSDWDVHALVDHVIVGSHRYTMLLHGASAADFKTTGIPGQDRVGEEALARFRSVADEMIAAFAEPGALARTVHHPAGDRPGQVLAGMRVGEFTVHGWDLARAVGADETLDADLVEWCWTTVSSMGSDLSEGGYFQAPRGEVPAGATTQDRLLHLLGRSP